MDFEIKVSDKLLLKLRKEEESQLFFDLVNKNREEFRKWFPWVDRTLSLEDTRKFIIKCQEDFKEKSAADFGVLYEGKWIGSMGFHTIKLDNGWAEVGYWLDSDYIGKGIMTDCVRAVIDYGFNELGLHRVQIRCDSVNVRSKAIPERLGFKLEGVMRENHKWGEQFSDGLIYGILKSEWK